MNAIRLITPFEVALINRIIYAGADRYHAIPVLLNEMVRELPEEGTIRFAAYSSGSYHKYPVEAEVFDDDQVYLHVLLFVNEDGRVSEFELYKDDGSSIMNVPPAEKWAIVDLPPP